MLNNHLCDVAGEGRGGGGKGILIEGGGGFVVL